jgi:DNA-directed RNA polymerase specialized sigma24 family protein
VEALLADLARSGLSTADIQMLRSVMNDVNSAEAGDALGINARSARNRRASALKRAREVLTVSVEDEGCS